GSSKIITDLDTIAGKIEEYAGDTLLRLRIFAQFQDISHSHERTDGIYLHFSNVPDFNAETNRERSYYFLIDETIYDEAFINTKSGERPHKGDILDMRCCYRKYDKVVEIMHLKVISIADLDSLREFLAKADDDSEIRSFLR
uniref:KLLA0E09417p n=1 Tax=Kluyveromyces lactis TaxID=28985 RepID=UPI0015C697C5